MQRRNNSLYVAIAGEIVNQRSALLKNFVLNGQESAFCPLLHTPANRSGCETTLQIKKRGFSSENQPKWPILEEINGEVLCNT